MDRNEKLNVMGDFMHGDDVMNLVLKDLSFQVVAAAFEVHNNLGCGFLEKVYENALLAELLEQGIKAETQKEIIVHYKGKAVGSYFADIVVENEVILELKCVDRLNKLHEAQILNYLKGTGMKLGILLNFGKDRVEHKRFVF